MGVQSSLVGTEAGQSAVQGHRTLAAIVFSDVVNFSGKMSQDEEHTLELVQRDLRVMTQLCEQFEGRVLKFTGDGLLMYFTSAVQAVACAQDIQATITAAAATLPAADVLQHRIGIHLGDVFLSDTDVMGDGVNIAARLQAEAEPGGICLSQIVYDVVKKRLALKATYLGPRELKHIQESVHIYQIVLAAQSQTVEIPQSPNANDRAPGTNEPFAAAAKSTRCALADAIPDTTRHALEQLLASQVGPIASLLVTQAIPKAIDWDDLVQQLSRHLPADQQDAFQAQAIQLWQAWDQATDAPVAPPVPAIVPDEALPTEAATIDPVFVNQCERELAAVIGPIAPLIVKRTLSQQPYSSRTQFIESLVKQITNPAQADRLRQCLLALL